MVDFGDIAFGAIIVAIAAGIIAAAVAVLCARVDFTPSSGGTMTDTVYSVEKSGLFWKRYEISFTNEHNMVYCARDEEIATKLKDAVLSKEKVTVRFNDELLVFDWDCSSNTIITEIIGGE